MEIEMKKTLWAGFIAVIASANLYSAEQLFTEQPGVMPELAKTGQYKVGVKTIEVVNPAQMDLTDFTSKKDRSLTLEVWYPSIGDKKSHKATYKNVTRLHKPFELQGDAYRDASALTEGQFPLVVLSHGYTGYRTIMFYLGEHLASHGYVVVGIDHTDSTTGDVDFNKSPGSGFVSTLVNRARDQQFVLEHFSHTSNPLSSITDTNNAAVVGYSMGGFGAINTVGGCYEFSAEGLQRLGFPETAAHALLPVFNFCQAGRDAVDPRWKSMIAFAPWGQELNVHNADSLKNIKVPTLYVTGDQDDISGHELGVKKMFEQTGSEHNYMLVYKNARHNFAPHPAPKIAYEDEADLGHYFEPAWNNEVLTRIDEHMSLAFLDCHVKGIQAKCDFLPKRVDITQVKLADGKLTPAWPGFAERWGTGVSFIRAKSN
jgi:predicted dienelactone hydrolase